MRRRAPGPQSLAAGDDDDDDDDNNNNVFLSFAGI